MKLVFLFQSFYLLLIGLSLASSQQLNQWLLPSLFPTVIPPYLKFSNSNASHSTGDLRKINFTNNKSRLPSELRPYLIWGKTLTKTLARREFYEQPLLASGFEISRKESQSDWFAKLGQHSYSSPRHLSKRSSRGVLSAPHQKYNHIPGLEVVENKVKHWSYFRDARSTFGSAHYNYLLDSFLFPSEFEQFKEVWEKSDDKVWIVKKASSKYAFGISLISHWSQLPTSAISHSVNNGEAKKKHDELLVQTILRTPYLVQKRKAEFRLLVLVTSMSPLRLYVSYSRVVKLPKCEYNPTFDVDDINGAILNAKFGNISANIERQVDLEAVLMSEFGPDGTAEIKAEFEDIIIKVLCTFQEDVSRHVRSAQFNSYNSFQILAFDFFIDSTSMKPYVIEVTGSPKLYGSGRRALDLAPVLEIAGFHLPRAVIPKRVLAKFGLKESDTFKEELYTFRLSGPEKRKQSQFGSSVLDAASTSCASGGGEKEAILERLTADDVRQLMIAENELARSVGTEWKRIYPMPVAVAAPAAALGSKANDYSMFMAPALNRYYARLFNAWEEMQVVKGRDHGIKILQRLGHKLGI